MENLAEQLMRLRPGATFVEFTANTEVSNQRKTDNPHWPIRKVAEYNGLLHFDYQENVRKRVEQAGGDRADFVADETYSEQIFAGNHLTALRRNKKNGRLYLWVRVMATKNVRYFAADGTEITWEDVKPFVREKKPSKKQLELGIEDEKQIKPCGFGLDNIITLSHRDLDREPERARA